MTTKIWVAGAALTLAALALPYGAAYAADEVAPATAPATAPAPQERLAKTGATTNGLLLVIGAILGGAGAGLLLLRLLEGPARKKGEEL